MIFTVSKDSELTKELIAEAIDWNIECYKSHFDMLNLYYMGRHSILHRVKQGNLKNNKIVVNHARYITRTNVGYLLGNAVDYKAEDIDIEPVLEQYRKQTITNVDVQVATGASKFGRAYDYTYVHNGDQKTLHTKMIDPRHGVVIYDDSMEHEPLFGVIYSHCDKDKYYGVIACDANFVYEVDEDLNIVGKTPHQFGMVPMIEYLNNDDYMGDYEDVLSMIDAYNILQSDRVNDKEQLVEALLLIKGFTLEGDQMKQVRNQRTMSVSKDADVSYVTKQTDEAGADILRQVLEADIHKISMTPNLADEQFAGNSSGVAIRYKLISFEQSIINKERAFERSLKQRFQLYVNYLSARGLMSPIDIAQVDAIFKRNLPQNDYETSQMINNLIDVVSRPTLLSQLSYVDNVEAEIEQVEKESLDKANREAEMFGTPLPNEGDQVTSELNKKLTEKLISDGKSTKQ